MPELPDVEGFRRYFARYAAGRRVVDVEISNAAIVRNASRPQLRRALRGRRLEHPWRVGKWMGAPAGGPILLFHFGMTGLFSWSADPGERHRHDRLVLCLDGGELRYRNMRMLGGVWLAHDGDEVDAITGPLGPDAAGIRRDQLERIVEGRRGGLKALLMDQRRIAGIGNELSDEVLWQARLHPARAASSLDRRAVGRLHRSLRDVIATSNRHARIPVEPGWLKSQRGAREPRCPRCRAAIRRSKLAGRTSYWCPRCQREPQS